MRQAVIRAFLACCHATGIPAALAGDSAIGAKVVLKGTTPLMVEE